MCEVARDGGSSSSLKHGGLSKSQREREEKIDRQNELIKKEAAISELINIITDLVRCHVRYRKSGNKI